MPDCPCAGPSENAQVCGLARASPRLRKRLRPADELYRQPEREATGSVGGKTFPWPRQWQSGPAMRFHPEKFAMSHLSRRTIKTALDRGPARNVVVPRREGSVPPSKMSSGAARKVSTARCQNPFPDAAGSENSTGSEAALNIRNRSAPISPEIRQASDLCRGSNHSGTDLEGLSHWMSESL
jgi:hypothetical protein